MRIVINGKPRDIDGELALPALLASLAIDPRLVAVGINGDVVAKDTYAATVVREGDELEIVRMVGGGAR